MAFIYVQNKKGHIAMALEKNSSGFTFCRKMGFLMKHSKESPI